MVFVLYSFAFFFNLHFMRMTRACWQMQKQIEEIFSGEDFKNITAQAPLFRQQLKNMIKSGNNNVTEIEGSKKITWSLDLLAWVTGGGYALIVILLLAYCWNFSEKCGCRIKNLTDVDAYVACPDAQTPQQFRFDDGQMKELLEKLGGNVDPPAGRAGLSNSATAIPSR